MIYLLGSLLFECSLWLMLKALFTILEEYKLEEYKLKAEDVPRKVYEKTANL